MNDDALLRRLTASAEGPDARELRARRTAEVLREANGAAWVGIYDVDLDRIELLGSAGSDSRTTDRVLRDAVDSLETAMDDGGIVVPILGAESGIAIGALAILRDAGVAFGPDERRFAEACADALIALYE